MPEQTFVVQRRRMSRRDVILDAVVEVISERGVAGASVELAIARAKVSRRTFYECFAGLEESLVTVLDGALERAAPLIAKAFAGGDSWQDGMRCALGAMLAFFDAEPALARVCLLETQAAGPLVRAHRERILLAFRALVVERIEDEVSHASPLAAEGAYASVVGIVNARLTGPEHAPLVELLGPLMGIIVGPFMDEAGVEREIERGDALARELLCARRPVAGSATAGVEIPQALRDPRAHRARACLCYLVAHPGASNSEIGEGIGVSHRGQIAALLAQLSGLRLLSKHAGGPGRPNAWWPTAEGQLVTRALEDRR